MLVMMHVVAMMVMAASNVCVVVVVFEDIVVMYICRGGWGGGCWVVGVGDVGSDAKIALYQKILTFHEKNVVKVRLVQSV